MTIMCEGSRRYGGALSLGPAKWVNCDKPAAVVVEVETVGGTLDTRRKVNSCIECWREALGTTSLLVVNSYPLDFGARYRKRPVEVRAKQWFKDGDHPAVYMDGDTPRIDTLEGNRFKVTPGDWIITGVKGEHYACKPGIFALSYEPV